MSKLCKYILIRRPYRLPAVSHYHPLGGSRGLHGDQANFLFAQDNIVYENNIESVRNNCN